MSFEIGGKNLRDLKKVAPGLQALARAELVQALDGPGRGQRLLEIATPGGLQATLMVDRSLDILNLSYRATPIGWRSRARAARPAGDLEGEDGLSLMRYLDGFLFTCGLDHHGLPERHDAQDMNYPPRRETIHNLHGRIALAGVTLTGYGIDWNDKEVIWIEARIEQTGVFNETLVLNRRIEFDLKKPTIRLIDHVENEGYRPARHHMLYHINIGYPLLDLDARLFGRGWDLKDRLHRQQPNPLDNHIEIVDLAPSPSGSPVIGISNAKADLSCAIGFDPLLLPNTALWQAYQSGVFALGIEPQTDKSSAATQKLEPGESRLYRLAFELGPARQSTEDI